MRQQLIRVKGVEIRKHSFLLGFAIPIHLAKGTAILFQGYPGIKRLRPRSFDLPVVVLQPLKVRDWNVVPLEEEEEAKNAMARSIAQSRLIAMFPRRIPQRQVAVSQSLARSPTLRTECNFSTVQTPIKSPWALSWYVKDTLSCSITPRT